MIGHPNTVDKSSNYIGSNGHIKLYIIQIYAEDYMEMMIRIIPRK